eukprot:scaffold14035_cov55-Attheya_sp.AAC.2
MLRIATTRAVLPPRIGLTGHKNWSRCGNVKYNSTVQKQKQKQKTRETTIPIWYGVVGGLAVTVAGGIKYVHDHVGGTEGLVRTASFYSMAIPKYIIYRMHMIRESPDEVWEELHKETSEAGLEKILELRGQMCASNIGNAFPVVWQDTMSILQDQCPPKDFAIVKSTIESEYGKSLNDVFSSFEEETIGAASIGQVHRATLLDGSPYRKRLNLYGLTKFVHAHIINRVVVKVMYPEVERLFRGDVRTIKMFTQIAQPVHVPALNEIEKQFMTEFDYRREAEQMVTIRENLTKAGLAGGPSKLCAVPKPHLSLCTKRVLVMEELIGEKLALALRHDAERHAARAGKTLSEFKADQEKQMQPTGGSNIISQTATGPTADQYNKYIRLENGKRKLKNTAALLQNYSLGWLPGVAAKPIETAATLPMNHAKLIDDLLYIHGHEVKRMPREMRLLMCKLIIALADDNKSDIVNLIKEAGYESENMDEDIIYKHTKVSYDEDNAVLTDGKHIQVYMEYLQDQDPVRQLPRDFIMVGRVSIMIRGLAHALNQSRSVAKAWKPIAEKVLRHEGIR